MSADDEQVEKARRAGGDDFVELGSTGLREQGGVLYEEERHALTGDRGTAGTKEMSAEDPTIDGALRALDRLVRTGPLAWGPAPGTRAGGEGSCALGRPRRGHP